MRKLLSIITVLALIMSTACFSYASEDSPTILVKTPAASTDAEFLMLVDDLAKGIVEPRNDDPESNFNAVCKEMTSQDVNENITNILPEGANDSDKIVQGDLISDIRKIGEVKDKEYYQATAIVPLAVLSQTGENDEGGILVFGKITYEKTVHTNGSNLYKIITVQGGYKNKIEPDMTANTLQLYYKAWGDRYTSTTSSRNVAGQEKLGSIVRPPVAGSTYVLTTNSSYCFSPDVTGSYIRGFVYYTAKRLNSGYVTPVYYIDLGFGDVFEPPIPDGH